MRIVRTETIIISKKESDALDLTDRLLEKMGQGTHDTELLKRVENAQAALSDVYQYIIDVEVEE